MKIIDSDIEKIERLAGAWSLEMPDERFFINLPAKVLDKAAASPRPWWTRVAAPAGAVAAMALLLAAGAIFAGREVRGTDRMFRAAAEWSSESADWDGIDRVLSEASEAGVSGLHHYLDPSGLETAVLAMDRDDYYTLASGL
jgi:hypothetical protein